MVDLTEDQKERIKKNRERALEIRRQRALAREKEAKAKATSTTTSATANKDPKGYGDKSGTNNCNFNIINNNDDLSSSNNQRSSFIEQKDEEDVELEDFEVGASAYVTKEEASKLYCLPPGTLAICNYIEKDNPRQSKWNKMKLYNRSEIRRRARERFGGLDGLVEERRKRENKRFQKDLDSGQEVFMNKKQKKF